MKVKDYGRSAEQEDRAHLREILPVMKIHKPEELARRFPHTA
jgi:plasmid stability protein